jgi:spore maturation protein SpmB
MTTAAARPRERSTGDLVATLLLIGFSVGAAVVMFFVALLWGVGAYDNTVAIVLGGYVPLALTVIGAVAGIVALSRRRRAVWYPLVALVLSIVVWIVAVSIVR